MIPIDRFMTEIRRQGIFLKADGEALHFDAPKGRMTAELRGQLVRRKPEILAFLSNLNLTRRPPLQPRDTKGELPLSFAQQRMWFLHQIGGASPAYNMAAPLRLKGILDAKAFESSLRLVEERHEVLRTNFPYRENRPCQEIAPCPRLRIPLVDLRALSQADRTREAAHLVQEEIHHRFDLAKRPLIRCLLLRVSNQDHGLLLNMHHIISDGWSTGILLRELSAYYHALAASQKPPWDSLRIQYADFALWQRGWLRGTVLDHHLRYWKQRLRGAPTLLELPTDRPRPAFQSHRGRRCHFSVSRHLTRRLEQRCRALNITRFVMLQSAFALLLASYSGQDDVVIGSPVANRNRKDLEPLIGFFVNTLPLRNRLEGTLSARRFVGQAHAMILDALAHQDLPFEKMVESLHLERHLSHQPLFQVMFIFQNLPLGGGRLAGVQIESLKAQSITAKFDLTLTMMVSGTELAAALEYNTSLFNAATMRRLTQHFQRCLAFLSDDLDTPLSKLNLLTGEDRQQILKEWNAGALSCHLTRMTARQPLLQWFEHMVQQQPDQSALVLDGKEDGCPQIWSYAYLNTRAQSLAYQLREMGMGPDIPAGIYLERSPFLILSILAVFKTGGTCLPLNPDYPPERLAFMIADAGCSLMLTRRDMAPLTTGKKMRVCYLEALPGAPQANPLPDGRPPVLPNLGVAYLIYTSGSTGRPKGVALAYAALVNLVNWSLARWTGARTTIQFAPISFDISFQEILVTLSCGESLVLISEETHHDPLALWRVIGEQRVARLYLPYTALLQLAQTHRPEFTAGCRLREIITAGEALRITDEVRKLFEALKECALYNHYGPSEAHVVSTYQLPSSLTDWPVLPPIGRPIDHTVIYLLNRYFVPAPIGVPAQLAIGGIPPARGYLNRFAASARTLVPDPFSDVPGLRLYLTGDLAKFSPDGQIEYLGRIDQQVKLRGFRVEPGEVEAHLERHDAIHEAAVVAVTGDHGGKRLIAYLGMATGRPCLSTETEQPQPVELRAFLKTKIPEFMIPADFVILDSLPKTSSGKIDRRSLPEPDLTRSRARERYVAPTTPEEQVLAETWCQILGLEQVGIHDNFFGIGGDSILSLQVIARTRHAGYELKPRHIFEYQTIAELVPQLMPLDQDATPADQAAVVGQVPLTPIQHFLLGRNLPHPHLLNIATMVVAPPGLDAGFLERALAALTAHHDSLRLKFKRIKGQWHQEMDPSDLRSTLFVFDLTHIEERSRTRAIQQCAKMVQESMDLNRGPLIRVGLMRLGRTTPGRLVIAVNHLASDGFAFQLVLADLLAAYRQIALAGEARFPVKSTSFKEWANRLHTMAQSEEMLAQCPYWLEPRRFHVKRLPVDFEDARERNTRASIDTLTVHLGASQTKRLLQEVTRRYDLKINEILIAGLAFTLAAWTGESRMVMDINVHGREPLFENVDVSRTVGCFTAMYPCYLEWDSGLDPSQALREIKTQLRNISHGGMGFGMLRYLSRGREITSGLKALPKAEILFNYIGQSNMAQAISARNALRPAPEAIALVHNHEVVRPWLFNIDAQVAGGQLSLLWMYSRHVHLRNTVATIANRFLNQLESFLKART